MQEHGQVLPHETAQDASRLAPRLIHIMVHEPSLPRLLASALQRTCPKETISDGEGQTLAIVKGLGSLEVEKVHATDSGQRLLARHRACRGLAEPTKFAEKVLVGGHPA